MSGSLAIIGSVLQGTATVVAVQYREDIAGTYWKVLPQWQCDIERIPPEKQGGTERKPEFDSRIGHHVKKGRRGACQQKAATVLPNRTAAA